jgi:transglutaminase-like putative cysteine protease
MDLGALDGLLDSDIVVLRVRGPRVDYLRGASLDLYEGGRWLRSDQAQVETSATFDRSLGLDGEPPRDQVVEIAAVSERTDRFFLPLEAHQIVTVPATVLVDDMGSIKRTAKHVLAVAQFVRGSPDRAGLAPPRAPDLQLPRRIRPTLERIALEWAGQATTTQGKLDAVEHRLSTEFRYSRTFHRAAGTDPALDFLLRDKSGHCEYFATAMALVARAAKIPVRVVVGYRVGERSPFGYYVVRERNAHAWVEAWVEGQGWTMRDPTPGDQLSQNREHEAGYAASAMDALRVGYIDLTDWLGRLTVQQTAVAWLAGFAVLVWIVARGARRRRKGTALVPADEAALPFLEQLFSTLARIGYPRREDEPVERLAARIPDPHVARLLERYAALRYGSIGNAQALAHDIAVYAKSIPRDARHGEPLPTSGVDRA